VAALTMRQNNVIFSSYNINISYVCNARFLSFIFIFLYIQIMKKLYMITLNGLKKMC